MNDVADSSEDWLREVGKSGAYSSASPRVAALHIVLAATDDRLALFYQDVAERFDWVRLHAGSILDVECDAVVSPANSFGFMDGGIDALYRRAFGVAIEEAVRGAILRDHDGELPVGEAVAVRTGSASIPYLIAAPTMRVPMKLPSDTVNPFLAARAVLRAVEHHSPGPEDPAISVVAIPGLGTGVGAVSPAVCARQVEQALRWATRPLEMPSTWAEASLNHQLLYTDRPGRLQH